MGRRSPEGRSAAEDCLRAAVRLRWRAGGVGRPVSEATVHATSELLHAVSVALAADPDSVPASYAELRHESPLVSPRSRSSSQANGDTQPRRRPPNTTVCACPERVAAEDGCVTGPVRPA